jgi:hypothetical protein
MKKMTPWFPPHIKPARKGVYQIKFTAERWSEGDDLIYATWNGLMWSHASYKKRDDFHKQFYGSVQDKYWRGFTEKQT